MRPSRCACLSSHVPRRVCHTAPSILISPADTVAAWAGRTASLCCLPSSIRRALATINSTATPLPTPTYQTRSRAALTRDMKRARRTVCAQRLRLAALATSPVNVNSRSWDLRTITATGLVVSYSGGRTACKRVWEDRRSTGRSLWRPPPSQTRAYGVTMPGHSGRRDRHADLVYMLAWVRAQ